MLEAHYSNISKAERDAYPSAKGKLTFATREGTDRQWHGVQYVKGKKDARDMAQRFGATPWNF